MNYDLRVNRRLFERFNVSLPVKIHDLKQAEINVCNVSAQGMQIASNWPLDQVTDLKLDITMPDSAEPMMMDGKVVWVNSQSPHLWSAGIKFHEIKLMRMSRLMKYAKTYAIDFDH
jgi:hypothetical protein